MTDQAQLSENKIRPRFKLETDSTIEDITDRIKQSVNAEEATCIARMRHGFIVLYVRPEDQHYWSPQLTLNIENLENGKTQIRGLYGPRPTVWTMFVFFYALVGLAILVIGTLGLSYLYLKKSSTILWAVPVLTTVFLSLYYVSSRGKKLGHNQMMVLEDFLKKSTGIEVLHKEH
jgi:hypothetical protein